MPKYSEALAIRERQRIVKILSKRGLGAGKISKRLGKIKAGRYAVSRDTVLRDLRVIAKARANWDKIHEPHQMDLAAMQRKELVKEFNLLINKAKNKEQWKTAGELIGKKARLLGIDKYEAPKQKKKTLIEEKYQHKTPEEINDILFQDFKDLSAALIRMARENKLSNIKRLSISVLREVEPGKRVRFIITRFGDEKKIKRQQEKLK